MKPSLRGGGNDHGKYALTYLPVPIRPLRSFRSMTFPTRSPETGKAVQYRTRASHGRNDNDMARQARRRRKRIGRNEYLKERSGKSRLHAAATLTRSNGRLSIRILYGGPHAAGLRSNFKSHNDAQQEALVGQWQAVGYADAGRGQDGTVTQGRSKLWCVRITGGRGRSH